MISLSVMDADEHKAKRAAYMREYTRRNRDRINKRRQERYAASTDLQQKTRKRVKDWKDRDPKRAKELKAASYNRNKVLKGRQVGELHHQWKGDEVSYGNLHKWVREQKGTPNRCEHCKTETAKRYEWANVDHKYRRNLDDFIRLCSNCHHRYDSENGLSRKGRKKK